MENNEPNTSLKSNSGSISTNYGNSSVSVSSTDDYQTKLESKVDQINNSISDINNKIGHIENSLNLVLLTTTSEKEGQKDDQKEVVQITSPMYDHLDNIYERLRTTLKLLKSLENRIEL